MERSVSMGYLLSLFAATVGILNAPSYSTENNNQSSALGTNGDYNPQDPETYVDFGGDIVKSTQRAEFPGVIFLDGEFQRVFPVGKTLCAQSLSADKEVRCLSPAAYGVRRGEVSSNYASSGSFFRRDHFLTEFLTKSSALGSDLIGICSIQEGSLFCSNTYGEFRDHEPDYLGLQLRSPVSQIEKHGEASILILLPWAV